MGKLRSEGQNIAVKSDQVGDLRNDFLGKNLVSNRTTEWFGVSRTNFKVKFYNPRPLADSNLVWQAKGITLELRLCHDSVEDGRENLGLSTRVQNRDFKGIAFWANFIRAITVSDAWSHLNNVFSNVLITAGVEAKLWANTTTDNWSDKNVNVSGDYSRRRDYFEGVFNGTTINSVCRWLDQIEVALLIKRNCYVLSCSSLNGRKLTSVKEVNSEGLGHISDSCIFSF